MHQIAKRKTGFSFIAVVAATLLVLTGCSSSTEKTETTYEQSANGVSLSITLTAEGDRLTKQTTESVLEYEPNGIADKDAAKETLDELVAEFKKVDGMTHEIEYGDSSATEIVVIDFTVVDFAELAATNGTVYEGDPQKNGLSLKTTSAQIEASGFTKVK